MRVNVKGDIKERRRVQWEFYLLL